MTIENVGKKSYLNILLFIEELAFDPVGLASDLDYRRVVDKPINNGISQSIVTKDITPF